MGYVKHLLKKNGRTPEIKLCAPKIQYLLKVIEFLGYVPFSPGESFPERLKAYRRVNGLSQRQLALELGVDPTTVMKWEAETSKPMRKTRERVEGVIDRVLFSHHPLINQQSLI